MTLIFGLVAGFGVFSTVMFGFGYWKPINSLPDPNTREGAMEMLRRSGRVYSVQDFASAVREDPPEVVGWYLKAGMPPNEHLSYGFIIGDAFRNRDHTSEIIDLFSDAGIDFHQINQMDPDPILHDYVPMGVLLLDSAIQFRRADVAKHLIQKNISTDDTASEYKKYCNIQAKAATDASNSMLKAAPSEMQKFADSITYLKRNVEEINGTIRTIRTLGGSLDFCPEISIPK